MRHIEGLVHGFLVLRTPEGNVLADGDLIQFAHGDRVTSRLIFHFRDGSVHDETVVFSQRRTFQLLSDHLIQKGASFPRPIEISIDRTSSRVKVRYQGKDGKEKTADERMDLPADVANGMVLTLLKNLSPVAPEIKVSMVAATPKPRLVKLVISPLGEEPFSIGSSSRKATRYVVKVEIGGLAGVLAPLLGKKPPDTYVWILGGEAPAFVKSEGPLYFGGPVWKIELTSPGWPKASAAAPARRPTREQVFWRLARLPERHIAVDLPRCCSGRDALNDHGRAKLSRPRTANRAPVSWGGSGAGRSGRPLAAHPDLADSLARGETARCNLESSGSLGE